MGPPLFPTFGLTLAGESESYSVVGDSNNNGTFLDQTSFGDSVSSEGTGINSNSVVIKKLNHNANERNRRKLTNSLFSSLRSCLPGTDETKKLSIPQTISRSLQYIPELQQEVKKLIQKKEDLLVRVSGKRERYVKPQPKMVTSNFSTVFASKLRDNEVMVQVSSSKIHKFSMYNVLSGLEQDGFVLLDVLSSSSRGERVFYTLHVQMDKIDHYKLNCEELSQRVLCLYEKCGTSFM